MTAGAQAVKARRAQAATVVQAAPTQHDTPFEMLAFGLLALIFQYVEPTLRTLWMLSLVCREWKQTIDAHLDKVAHRYYVIPSDFVRYADLFVEERKRINLFVENGWMVDVRAPLELTTLRFRHVREFRLDAFPYGSDQSWLYSMVSQLGTLPLLEEIQVGSDGWHGMHLDDGADQHMHFAILRVLFAQLKRVHTFHGTLGLIDFDMIQLVDVIKDMPALRNIDFGSPHCVTHNPGSAAVAQGMSEAMESLSNLRLDSLKGVSHDALFWTHFAAAKQLHLRTFEICFVAQGEDSATDLVHLIDQVRLLPALKHLTLFLTDIDSEFCTSDYSREHDRAPLNVAFCRALQSQLEQLVVKVMRSRHSLSGSDDTQEALIQRALGILAPQIVLDFDGI